MNKKNLYQKHKVKDLVTDTSTKDLNSYVVGLSAIHFDEPFKSLCLNNTYYIKRTFKLPYEKHNKLIINYLVYFNTPKNEYLELIKQIKSHIINIKRSLNELYKS
jgi:hypothetical protein